jgi:hypothetical protein
MKETEHGRRGDDLPLLPGALCDQVAAEFAEETVKTFGGDTECPGLPCHSQVMNKSVIELAETCFSFRAFAVS